MLQQKVSVRQEGIGASWESICYVKAFTCGLDNTAYSVSVVAKSSVRTLKRTNVIWAGRTQTRAYQRLGQSICINPNFKFLRVLLADEPFAANIDSQCHFILYTRSMVASTVARICWNTLVIISVNLTVV